MKASDDRAREWYLGVVSLCSADKKKIWKLKLKRTRENSSTFWRQHSIWTCSGFRFTFRQTSHNDLQGFFCLTLLIQMYKLRIAHHQVCVDLWEESESFPTCFPAKGKKKYGNVNWPKPSIWVCESASRTRGTWRWGSFEEPCKWMGCVTRLREFHTETRLYAPAPFKPRELCNSDYCLR